MQGWLQNHLPANELQLIPLSGLYLEIQSGRTQFVEWTEGPEDSQTD